MLQNCSVKLQKCFVDKQTSSDSPSAWGSADNDCILIFGWTVPLSFTVGKACVCAIHRSLHNGKLYVNVPNPTCLVRCDVDHGIKWWLVAEVRHCIHGHDAEGVVGVSHQVEHRHPGLCQSGLAGNESNCCVAQTLHQSSSPATNTRPRLPSASASRGGCAVLAGPSFSWALQTQNAVLQVAATSGIQRAIPL